MQVQIIICIRLYAVFILVIVEKHFRLSTTGLKVIEKNRREAEEMYQNREFDIFAPFPFIVVCIVLHFFQLLYGIMSSFYIRLYSIQVYDIPI